MRQNLSPGSVCHRNHEQKILNLHLSFIKICILLSWTNVYAYIQFCSSVYWQPCVFSSTDTINGNRIQSFYEAINKRNTSLAAPGALADRLQRRTACKIRNGCQGALKWPTGSGKGSNPRLLAAPKHFHNIRFYPRTLSMRKLRGEKKNFLKMIF